ncbi:MAG: putative pyridoxal-dependent aspartate 1-decarboxylase [Pseudomonadales bacterium]|nr:putative pyridoxal-dependent aspartate 1-decarboxylase [Pseudomonadales bacterium]
MTSQVTSVAASLKQARPEAYFLPDNSKKSASATLESLYQIFTVPEAPNSTLGRIEQDISRNLVGFLQEHIVAVEKDLSELEKDFSESSIPNKPMFVSEQAEFLLQKVVAQSVHTSSPSFVGHMTSALPHFMLPLSKIMMALNQNLVKIETSKAFTPLERQVLGMLHRLVYEGNEGFYDAYMHDRHNSLGAFCSGGTIANITALWVARNKLLRPEGEFKGVSHEGMYRALKHYGYDGIAVLVSERGHYSLGKSTDILGIGRADLVSIPTDSENRIDVAKLEEKCRELEKQNIKLMAIIGIAGTTETGTVDSLDLLADVAERENCHFHVDAAWGGPTLFSRKYKDILKGIDRADSVTIDAHKQLYVPMGAGVVVFKDPTTLTNIEHHAEYIIRRGSKDLGSHTIEGSRPGMAMLVHSGLKVIGRQGYELLVDQGLEKARKFAEMIRNDEDFELISKPELNILTYRYVPKTIQALLADASPEQSRAINEVLNRVTKRIQKAQRARGKAFVSRTQLTPVKYDRQATVVFRVVLANPLTTMEILQAVLDEQKELTTTVEAQDIIEELNMLVIQYS